MKPLGISWKIKLATIINVTLNQCLPQVLHCCCSSVVERPTNPADFLSDFSRYFFNLVLELSVFRQDDAKISERRTPLYNVFCMVGKVKGVVLYIFIISIPDELKFAAIK